MKYTLVQAAQEVNRSKSSLWRDIKKGIIAYEKDDNGTYLIDASELFRIHPKSFHKEHDNVALKKDETTSAMRIMELELLLNMERERVSEKERYSDNLKQQVEDIRKDRDHWRQQATYLVEDKREKQETSRSWFERIFKS